MSGMNILIEKNETLEYLTNDGQWSKNPLVGRRFPATTVAFQAARQEFIGKFNIVCHIPETNQFINMNHGRGKGISAAVVEDKGGAMVESQR